MARRSALLAALLVPSTLVLWAPAPASAGGGCHTGVTTGTDPTVVMVEACFTSTITYVDPGQEVTFLNKDPMTHNVTANGWGHFDGMSQDDRFSVTFEEDGVYPFACSYHPGMSGAIVVGDADGAGTGSVPPVTGPAANGDAAVLEDASPIGAAPSGAGSEAWPWLGGAVIGLVLGIGVGILGVRRRHGAAA